ncbi:hypothetical protein B0H13DRAFT_1926718 [Mycena leptocephala]|nr:hypothetical protein B0H13DRAFT_1926718 [Mycena leptocephala]
MSRSLYGSVVDQAMLLILLVAHSQPFGPHASSYTPPFVMDVTETSRGDILSTSNQHFTEVATTLREHLTSKTSPGGFGTKNLSPLSILRFSSRKFRRMVLHYFAVIQDLMQTDLHRIIQTQNLTQEHFQTLSGIGTGNGSDEPSLTCAETKLINIPGTRQPSPGMTSKVPCLQHEVEASVESTTGGGGEEPFSYFQIWALESKLLSMMAGDVMGNRDFDESVDQVVDTTTAFFPNPGAVPV